jgi:hypothetical protein
MFSLRCIISKFIAMVGVFSLGTPASSTTKTGRHDIAEILLKVALGYNKCMNQSIIMLDSS